MIDDLDPARIMMAGDWHGNHNWGVHCIRHARKQGVDVIVHTGDFGWWTDPHHYLATLQKVLAELRITIVWVDGNHENHDKIDEWLDATDGQPWSDKRYPNIIHLPRGFRWQWWGETWLALGGAHSVDRLQRLPGRSWWDREHISDAEIERAITGGPVDVMVTHDCPFGVEIPGINSDDDEEDSRRSGWPLSEIRASNEHRKKVREVCDVVRPKFLFHGHYHRYYANLLRYGDGEVTKVVGLDCDSTTLEGNTILLHRR